jgi:AraC-like DNA-binding protein
MMVYSLLGPVETNHLRRAVPQSWFVRSANVDTVLRELAMRAGGAVVLDASDVRSTALDELVSRCGQAAARMVLCGTSGVGVKPSELLAAVSRANVELFANSISDGAQFLPALVAMRASSIPVGVLKQLAASVLRLPPPARASIVSFFSFARLPGRAAHFYQRLARQQSTVCRWFAIAGLASPSRVLTVARLARAAHLSLVGERSRETVRKECGFGSEDAMQAAFRDRLGLRYGDPVIESAPQNIVTRLAKEASAKLR